MNQIGDNINTIDFAAEEIERLQTEYGFLGKSVEELLEAAAHVPLPINDLETKERVMSLVKSVRDQAKRIDGIHELEKMPHLRRGQAADQFFFALIDKLARRARANKPGIADTLSDALTDYDERERAIEMARREQEAAKARKEAEAKAKAEAEAARIAEEARLAAERARNPQKIIEKEAAAVAAEIEAEALRADAARAAEKAEDAYISTLAKPADVMRHRAADGTLGTMQREPYAEIVNADQLDMAKLWPFISLDAKEKALRAWARTTNHSQQMPGAAIGFRNKSKVR